MVQDLLDHRSLEDGLDNLELQLTAIVAVLHRRCGLQFCRQAPNQAAPNRPLLKACKWPVSDTQQRQLPGIPDSADFGVHGHRR